MSFNEIEHPRTAHSVVRLTGEGSSSSSDRDARSGGATSDGFVQRLLGEQGTLEFRQETWQRRHLIISSDAASALGDSWLTVDDIDELFSSVDFPVTNLDLADGSQPLPKGSYAPGGSVERGRVLSLHRQGATIILRAAHRWSAKLRRLCAGLEWDFGFPAQANIYLTPSGKKSTPPHWDTHDLFIVQVAGMKKWRLFSSDYILPLDSQRFSEETFPIGPLRDEITIKAGEVLYLPRGTIHEPVADSYSTHVSLGVLVSRWSDLLLKLVRAVSEDMPELRSVVELPAGRLDGFTQAELADRLLSLVELLRDRPACGKAVRRHIEELLPQHGEDQERLLLRMFRQTKLSTLSRLVRVGSAYIRLESNAGRLYVYWKRGRFSVPAQHVPFIEAALSGRPFCIEDAPQCGDVEERLALCEALIQEGLLEVDDSD